MRSPSSKPSLVNPGEQRKKLKTFSESKQNIVNATSKTYDLFTLMKAEWVRRESAGEKVGGEPMMDFEEGNILPLREGWEARLSDKHEVYYIEIATSVTT